MSEAKINIPIKWDQEAPDPLPANVVHIHRTPYDEVILSFGHGSTLLYGSLEEQQQQANSLTNEGGITIRPNARLVLPLMAVQNLVNYLDALLKDVEGSDS